MKTKILGFIIVLSVFSAGCGIMNPLPAQATETLTEFPSTLTIEPTPTITLQPSPTAFISFKVTTAVDHVNIRNNPGYLFSIDSNVKTGTVLEVLGRSPGGEWINVKTTSGTIGWVYYKLIQTAADLQSLPVNQPQNVQLICGKVTDSSGDPVSGIVFNVIKGYGADAPTTNAMTDSTGMFYAFIPMTSTGDWLVSYAGIGCVSNKMDENCNCKNGLCGTADPGNMTITVPQAQPAEFGWK